jgi:aryl-alcohol dehydrogenase-like predicted oxidoreductase
MASSTQLRSPAIETEFVGVPATQLKVSRVALGTWALGGMDVGRNGPARVDRHDSGRLASRD